MDLFQGKPIITQVDEFMEDNEEETLKQVAHPEITKYITGQLNKEMNYYFIRNYGK